MSEVFTYSRVTTVTTIRRVRRMPPSAVPRVRLNEPVKPADVIAFDEHPGLLKLVHLAEALRVDPEKAEAYLRKKLGAQVSKGEVLAERKLALGLQRLRVTAPMAGTISHVGNGVLIIEGERRRTEYFASVPGRVVNVEIGKQVTIETVAALIQIAWGVGGVAWGTLRSLDTAPSLKTPSGRFNIDHRGALVAIGSPLTEDFLEEAADIGVKGLIASSMHSGLIGRAQKAGFPIGITQGFGQYPISERILSLLNTYNGREIAVDMSTSIDWRDMRPEIIIPVTGQTAPEDRSGQPLPFKVGNKVRILQRPYLGEIGTVSAVPAEKQEVESGLWVSGVTVQPPTGRALFVPVANLEHLG